MLTKVPLFTQLVFSASVLTNVWGKIYPTGLGLGRGTVLCMVPSLPTPPQQAICRKEDIFLCLGIGQGRPDPNSFFRFNLF